MKKILYFLLIIFIIFEIIPIFIFLKNGICPGSMDVGQRTCIGDSSFLTYFISYNLESLKVFFNQTIISIGTLMIKFQK